MRRVVVTGLGMVSPVGANVEESWNNAVNANSGIDKISGFDASELKVKIAAEVKNFDPSEVISKKDQGRLTKFIQFSAVAAHEAIKDSGLDCEQNPHRIGCSIGVGLGALEEIEKNTKVLEEKGEKRISPFFIPYTIPNMAAGYVSILNGLKGPNLCPTTACASGTHGIGEAFNMIRNNAADAMVCGGSESTISKLGIASFTALKALSTSNEVPAAASRPFDAKRNGFVMGEGAGILVLEEYEAAKKRGARIYAEVVGYGLTGDGNHITAPAPEGEGGARCMKMALEAGGIEPSDVDYINAHGTSTGLNDKFESMAIMSVFGDHAKKVSISSTKGVTGHCIGAAGGVEGVFTVLSIVKGLVPPTANLENPDEDCPLDYTPLKAVEKKVRVAMSNSFGFGGTNATVVFREIG